MKNFWAGILQSALSGALQAGNAANQQGGNLNNTGITAGVGAIAGILSFLLQHPATASTVTTESAKAVVIKMENM